MGANPEFAEEAEPAPPPPGSSRVEITVAGHTVAVESPDPLADVVGYALSLYEQTAGAAARSPVGFDTAGGNFERATLYAEGWEDDRAGRLDRDQRHLQARRAAG